LIQQVLEKLDAVMFPKPKERIEPLPVVFTQAFRPTIRNTQHATRDVLAR
jgi:hypothetical protein